MTDTYAVITADEMLEWTEAMADIAEVLSSDTLMPMHLARDLTHAMEAIGRIHNRIIASAKHVHFTQGGISIDPERRVPRHQYNDVLGARP